MGNARHILLVVVWDLQCDLQSTLCFPCVCVLLGSLCMVHVALLSVLGLSESDGNMITRKRI